MVPCRSERIQLVEIVRSGSLFSIARTWWVVWRRSLSHWKSVFVGLLAKAVQLTISVYILNRLNQVVGVLDDRLPEIPPNAGSDARVFLSPMVRGETMSRLNDMREPATVKARRLHHQVVVIGHDGVGNQPPIPLVGIEVERLGEKLLAVVVEHELALLKCSRGDEEITARAKFFVCS